MRWPTHKRHKHYSESECGMYMVTKDGDGLMCGWRRGTVTTVCMKPGCGRYQTPCAEDCRFETGPGWVGVGCTRDWSEMKGLLEGSLTPADLKHGPKVPFTPVKMSLLGDIPQTGDIDQTPDAVDTDSQ